MDAEGRLMEVTPDCRFLQEEIPFPRDGGCPRQRVFAADGIETSPVLGSRLSWSCLGPSIRGATQAAVLRDNMRT